MHVSDPPESRPPRLPVIDVARGVALLAMFVFHFTWDLGFFGFISLQAGQDPGWRWFARCIAGSFLILVGVSLVLASRGGMNWRAYWRRLTLVGGAALAITAATWFATPDEFIFFGILHCIALASVLALAFLRAPAWLTALLAAAIVVLPAVIRFPALNSPSLLWLGLGDVVPRTNDYEPLFPWFGLVLAGVALARAGLAIGWEKPLARVQLVGSTARTLAWGGRHSLVLYLLHQPIFFGGLALLASVTNPASRSVETGFHAKCLASCQQSGAATNVCTAACGCVEAKIRTAQRANSRISEQEISRRMPNFVAACQREREPAPPKP
ncbi:hypothetical protein SLNSH_11325 [Alsobacter soli]|uniref:Heparan-alpha-glucosaminide N-acetyltransferase catalytic domain-containing protein n=1 Tax=Alsobacter soli TaxID=2109933 RepID=A0A2T1HTQ9_9HYPH|nr:heparan-alpha-glucosaminide N-acetyltransferase [Alsobacter soli]PSC05027.1 hypothetical protein SLNSH_11325 [Alsobacter soli]